MFYNVYSEYLVKKYGEKVYKLPVNIKCTCPNRDGTVGTGGCTYCGEKGAGFESLPDSVSVAGQLKANMDYIGKKYNAKKFIAYFQNFSNTYMPPAEFMFYINQAAADNIVGIDVSTRPDCISAEYLDILKSTGLDITVELGLQTVNYHTLRKINRGHTLAEFIEAVGLIKSYGFKVCAHIILDLPYDDEEDVIECAKILSVLKVDFVKLHSLYIVYGTKLDEEYTNGSFRLLTCRDYVNRCTLFLRYLSPDTVVQRLIGRAPKEDCRTANFNMSWWKIKDLIEENFARLGAVQGDMSTYSCRFATAKFTKGLENMITYKKVTEDNTKPVAALAEEIWYEHYTRFIDRKTVEGMVSRAQSAEAIAQKISEGYEYYLICSAADTIGYFAVKNTEKGLYLDKAYIKSRFRGQGYFSELIKRLSQRTDRIYLSVNSENTSSINAYKAAGFGICGEAVNDFGEGAVFKDYIMEKNIQKNNRI